MAYFILYHNAYNASNVANLYFRKVVKLYQTHKSIVFGRGTMLLSHSWLTLHEKDANSYQI